jgi:glucose/arabinose dehydrogenase
LTTGHPFRLNGPVGGATIRSEVSCAHTARRGRILAAVYLCALAGFAAGPTTSVASAQSVELEPFGGQIFEEPFHAASPPGDRTRVFNVEGTGTIRLVKDGVTQTTPFLDLNAQVLQRSGDCGECGMFSIAFAPDYERTGLFYVVYTRDSSDPAADYYVRLQEFRRSGADPDIANPASARTVLEVPRTEGQHHNAGQLQFGSDGFLYLTIGDAGVLANAQRLETLNGKLLRINPRGATDFAYTIPADNPFVDGAGPNRDEIYAYGLRNPFRFSFDRSTGDLALADVGGAAFEEVNFAVRGAARGDNYGWSCFEGAQETDFCAVPPTNHTPPVLEYPHSTTGGSSIAGGFVIRDGALPSLLGRYIFADSFETFDGELQTARLATSGDPDQQGLGLAASFVVSFGEDACGHIYVLTIGGNVYRLEPSSGPLPCAPQPVAPQITDTDPDSPADDNAPEVKGSAPAGSTVRIHDDPSCGGTPLATGSAAAFESPGLTISVADDTSTDLYALATVGGETSPCSSAGFTYTERSAPTGPEPSPSNVASADLDPPETAIDRHPKKNAKTRKRSRRARFAFSADEPSTFLCRLDKRDSRPCSSPERVRVKRGRHTFRVVAVDQAGNGDPKPARWRWRVRTTSGR